MFHTLFLVLFAFLTVLLLNLVIVHFKVKNNKKEIEEYIDGAVAKYNYDHKRLHHEIFNSGGNFFILPMIDKIVHMQCHPWTNQWDRDVLRHQWIRFYQEYVERKQ